jgi:hypothetical protein
LFEILNSTLFWLVCIFLTLSLILLLLVKDADTPRWLDIITGLMLISTSALFIGMLTSIQALVKAESDGSNNYSLLIDQYQVAILILPFVSAAIGTNLISHALTYHHDYKAPCTFVDEIKRAFKILLIILATISVIGLVIWGAVVFFKKKLANA